MPVGGPNASAQRRTFARIASPPRNKTISLPTPSISSSSRLFSLALLLLFTLQVCRGSPAGDICETDAEQRAMISAWSALLDASTLLGSHDTLHWDDADWNATAELLDIKLRKTRDRLAGLLLEKAKALCDASVVLADLQLGPGSCSNGLEGETIASPFFSNHIVDLAGCNEWALASRDQDLDLLQSNFPQSYTPSELSSRSLHAPHHRISPAQAGQSFDVDSSQSIWWFLQKEGKLRDRRWNPPDFLSRSGLHRPFTKDSHDAQSNSNSTLPDALASLLFTTSFPKDVVLQGNPPDGSPDELVETSDALPEFNLTRLGNRYGRVTYVDFQHNFSATYPRDLTTSSHVDLSSLPSTQAVRSPESLWDYPNLQPDQAAMYDQADIALIIGYQTCNQDPTLAHDLTVDLLSNSYGEYELLYDDPTSYDIQRPHPQRLIGPQERKRRIQGSAYNSRSSTSSQRPGPGYMSIAVDIARAIAYGVSRRSSLSVTFASSLNVISMDGSDGQAWNRLDRIDAFLEDVLADAKENVEAGDCILPTKRQFIQALRRVARARRDEMLVTRSQGRGEVYNMLDIFSDGFHSASFSGEAGSRADRVLGDGGHRGKSSTGQKLAPVKPLVIYLIGNQMNLASTTSSTFSSFSDLLRSSGLSDSSEGGDTTALLDLMSELTIQLIFVPIDLDPRLSEGAAYSQLSGEATRLQADQLADQQGSYLSVTARDIMYRKSFVNLYRSLGDAVYCPFATADYLDNPFIRASLFSTTEKFARAAVVRFQIEHLMKPLMRPLANIVGSRKLSEEEAFTSAFVTATDPANGLDDYWLATPFRNPYGVIVTSLCKRVTRLEQNLTLADAPTLASRNHIGNLCVELALSALLSLSAPQASQLSLYIVDSESLNVVASDLFMSGPTSTCAWNPGMCEYLTQLGTSSNYLQLGWNVLSDLQPRDIFGGEPGEWRALGAGGLYTQYLAVVSNLVLLAVLRNPSSHLPAPPHSFVLPIGGKACWHGAVSSLNYSVMNTETASLLDDPDDAICRSVLYLPPEHFLSRRPVGVERLVGLSTAGLTDPTLGYHFYRLQAGELGPIDNDEENPLRVEGVAHLLASELRYLTFFQDRLEDAYHRLDALLPGAVYAVGLMFVDGAAISYPPSPCAEYVESLRSKLGSAGYAEYVVDCTCMCRTRGSSCGTCSAQAFVTVDPSGKPLGAGFIVLDPTTAGKFFDALVEEKAEEQDHMCFLRWTSGTLADYSPAQPIPVIFLPEAGLAGDGMLGSWRAQHAGVVDGQQTIEDNIEYHRCLARNEMLVLRKSFGDAWRAEQEAQGKGWTDWWEQDCQQNWKGHDMLTGSSTFETQEGTVKTNMRHSYLSRSLYYLWLNRYLECQFSHDGLVVGRKLGFSPRLQNVMESLRKGGGPPVMGENEISSQGGLFSRLSKYTYQYLRMLRQRYGSASRDDGSGEQALYHELGIEYAHVGLLAGLRGLLIVDPKLGSQFDLEPECTSYSEVSQKMNEIMPHLYVAGRVYATPDFSHIEYADERPLPATETEKVLFWVIIAVFVFWLAALLLFRVRSKSSL